MRGTSLRVRRWSPATQDTCRYVARLCGVIRGETMSELKPDSSPIVKAQTLQRL